MTDSFTILSVFSYCFTHNFKVIFLIDRTTFWQEPIMHRSIVIEENGECLFRSWLFWQLLLGWLSFCFVTSYALFDQIWIGVEVLWAMRFIWSKLSFFSAFGEQLVPLIYVSFAQRRLTKYHSQHFKCIYFIFHTKFNPLIKKIVENSKTRLTFISINKQIKNTKWFIIPTTYEPTYATLADCSTWK